MNDTIKEQIIAIAESGLTNMFDTRAVRQIAEAWEYTELIEYLDKHRGDYAKFILYGEV